jgi:monofunctional glycosyltransferase
MRFTFPKKISVKQILKKLLNVCVLLFQIALLSAVLFRVVPVPLSPRMVMEFAPVVNEWVPYESINKNVVIAAMTSEDPHFNEHNGFELKAIKDAIENNMGDDGKPLRGGSTISQQTAKNVFLFHGGVANWMPLRYIRKGLEIPFTVLIEVMWTKRRIMEVYLNIIEMGDGVYGIQAAAKHYYNKPASKLNAKEAASIVVCFPNPITRKPIALKPRLQRKRDRTVRWMAGYQLPPNLQ